MLAIVDYGVGNLFSLTCSLRAIGAEAVVTGEEEALARAVAAHPLTLADPEPMIRVEGYRDSAIEYVVRVWCANADYWTVYYDLLEEFKAAFDAAGIEMTYPHVNVHMLEAR